jgi:uncharacterized protein YdaL
MEARKCFKADLTMSHFFSHKAIKIVILAVKSLGCIQFKSIIIYRAFQMAPGDQVH